MSTNNSIVKAVIEQMPKHAEHQLTENGSSLVLSIYWKLNNDPERPNKYSKTIVIFIARELIEDFKQYPIEVQRSALEKISSYIAEKLKEFDPNHIQPSNMVEPREQWLIPIDALFD